MLSGARLCACGAFALAIVRAMPLPRARLLVAWISNGYTGQPALDFLLGDVVPMALALLAATALFESPARRVGEADRGDSVAAAGGASSVLPASASILVVLLRGVTSALAIISNDVVQANALLQKTYALDRSKRFVVGLPVEVSALYLLFSLAFHAILFVKHQAPAPNPVYNTNDPRGGAGNPLRRGSSFNADFFAGVSAAVVARVLAEGCTVLMAGANAMGCLVTLIMTTFVYLYVGTEAFSGVRLPRLQNPTAMTESSASSAAAFLVALYLSVQAIYSLTADPARTVALGVHQPWGGACGEDGAFTVCMSDIRLRRDMPWELCENSFESRAIGGVHHEKEQVHVYAICGRKDRLGGYLFDLRAWRLPVCGSAAVWVGLVTWCYLFAVSELVARRRARKKRKKFKKN